MKDVMVSLIMVFDDDKILPRTSPASLLLERLVTLTTIPVCKISDLIQIKMMMMLMMVG